MIPDRIVRFSNVTVHTRSDTKSSKIKCTMDVEFTTLYDMTDVSLGDEYLALVEQLATQEQQELLDIHTSQHQGNRQYLFSPKNHLKTAENNNAEEEEEEEKEQAKKRAKVDSSSSLSSAVRYDNILTKLAINPMHWKLRNQIILHLSPDRLIEKMDMGAPLVMERTPVIVH
jgi:hypothetical protein